MREYKFRAWDKHAKIMRDDGTSPNGMPHMKYDVGIMPRHAKNSWATGIDGLEIRVNSNDFELMQFTELTDINGKEIYEGDIVIAYDAEQTGVDDEQGEIMTNVTGQVIFEDGAYYYEGHSAGNIPLAYNIEDIEVIGNIYETPELLKQ